MTGMSTLHFAPLIPLALLLAFGVAALSLTVYAVWRRARGAVLRALAMAFVLFLLAGPHVIEEDRVTRPDVVIVLEDKSRSQALGDRPAQNRQAREALESIGRADPDLDIQVTGFGANKTESALAGALEMALNSVEASRLSAIVILSDGVLRDPERLARLKNLRVPLHHLMTGDDTDFDRSLDILNAPEYAIVDRPTSIEFRIVDRGPASPARTALVTVRADGKPIMREDVTLGQATRVWTRPTRRGPLNVDIEVEGLDGEITTRNNRALIAVNAVRDRLKVLLVSGEPHVGERIWRSALQADPAVDLIHFTILRLPTSIDATHSSELSLIPFPTDRLFVEQLNDFDLVIFDRYTLRGVLQFTYLRNLVDYVKGGGAILVSSGPEYSEPLSLYATPLRSVLPAEPLGETLNGVYRPVITALGRRHPVTNALGDEKTWSPWYRIINTRVRFGDVLMADPAGRPLLVLGEIGDGRIAQLLSDQVWLWARDRRRGPHAELLRRVSHWLMGEPELEEESLTAALHGNELTVNRQSLTAGASVAIATDADGKAHMVQLVPGENGISTGTTLIDASGPVEVTVGALTTYAGLDLASAREFARPLADASRLAPYVTASGGGTFALTNGMPRLRRVDTDARQFGRDWLGLPRRDAYVATASKTTPLMPPVLAIWLALMLFAAAWWREAR